MFKIENTGTPSWKRVLDEEDKYIASLNELYSGDWALSNKNDIDVYSNWIGGVSFSNPSKAAVWLWKNRHNLGEPFNLYEEKEKPSKKSKKPEPVVIEEEPSEDLFWNYKK